MVWHVFFLFGAKRKWKSRQKHNTTVLSTLNREHFIKTYSIGTLCYYPLTCEWIANRCTKRTQKPLEKILSFILECEFKKLGEASQKETLNFSEKRHTIRKCVKCWIKRKQTRKVNLQNDCKPNKLFFLILKLVKNETSPLQKWPQTK